MRKERPSGKEISEKSKKINLLKDKSIEAEKEGKKIKFTPVKLEQLNSVEELEDGQIIGILENELEGDETKLPPGKHNLFLANVEGKWNVYAEANGEIKAEATKVELKKHYWGEQKAEKPKFHSEGWCIGVCIVSCFWFFCLVEVWVCF